MRSAISSLMEKAPSPRFANALALAMLSLWFVVIAALSFGRHIPSPLAVQIAFIAALPVAVFVGWQSLDGGLISLANPRVAAELSSNWLIRSAWTRVPAMSLVFFVPIFLGVRDVVLAGVTEVVGQPASRTVTVTGVVRPRTGCDHFAIAEVWFAAGRGLCASEDQITAVRHGDRLVLEGRASPFGIVVDRYTPAP